MQRQYLIAGNWKMNTTSDEASDLLRQMVELGVQPNEHVDVLFCPPFLSISSAIQALSGSHIHVGAQDCSQHLHGAFTGEVSAESIRSIGCSHVLIGHSERRQYHGETDDSCNAKIHTAMDAGLAAVYCIGETAEEREQGRTADVLSQQLLAGLRDVQQTENLVIAYEPVWAIGQSAATPEQIREAHASIRTVLVERFGEARGAEVFILYGGSLNASNAREILSVENVAGGLIGGASLKPDAFSSIIATAKELTQA